MQLTWCHCSFLSINSHAAFYLLFVYYSLTCGVMIITWPIQRAVGLLVFFLVAENLICRGGGGKQFFIIKYSCMSLGLRMHVLSFLPCA